jgi:UDPglucose 6-dehydrogenase
MNIAVIGLGKLGGSMAALFAASGHDVVGIDSNPEIVDKVNRGEPPNAEPEVEKLTTAAHNANMITASTDYAAAAKAEIVVIIVPTPSDADDEFDPSLVVEAVREVAPHLGPGMRTVVVTSTVMPGTMDSTILPALEEASGRKVGENIGLIYSPELVALGDVVNGLRSPDIKMVGAHTLPTGPDVAAVEQYKRLLNSFLAKDVPCVAGPYIVIETA